MGKRVEHRVTVSLPIRLSGLDQQGHPFVQTATTLDVSRTGARLSGIRCLRGPGEMVQIEFAGHSAQFRVVWVGRVGTGEDGQVGLKCLQPERSFWRVQFRPPSPDTYQGPSSDSAIDPFAPIIVPTQAPWDNIERRSFHRRRCAGIAQIKQSGVNFPIWARVSDVSFGGCYVELVFTIPRETKITLDLKVNQRTFEASGIVVTSHPGVGIGVKFTEMSPEHETVLGELMAELFNSRRHPASSASEQA